MRQVLEDQTLSYNNLADWARAKFDLPARPSKPTISRVPKAMDVLRQLPPDQLDHKNARSKTQLAINQSVVEFVALCELEDLSLSGAMIMAQAKRIADQLHVPAEQRPRFGWAWLRHLELRHGIRWRRAYGESESVDITIVAAELQQLRCDIRAYRPCDVFNMDESVFFYNAAPRGSICINKAPALKQDKARVTMALCCNATGSEKEPVLFVDKAAAPRWLPDKPDDMQYVATKKVWMTTEIYQQWLQGFDQKMRLQDRRVLLLVDNASAHCDEGLELTNVVVKKLPPNTTAKIQPLDQGIIYCFKRTVLAKKMEFALDNICSGKKKPYKVNLLCAMTWCKEAWSKVSAKTIENCWHHSGLIDKASINFILN